MLGIAALGCAALGSLMPGAATSTATKVGMQSTTSPAARWDGVSAYVNVNTVRQQNFVAATGKTFDYRIILTAQQNDGTVDTTYTGTATATVAVGSCTLGGTVSRAAVAGVWDFSDLYPATGTGSLAITFTVSGLTSFTTATMTVVTPQYHDLPLTNRSLSMEKPRLEVDATAPTVFARTIMIDPVASVVTGVSYRTVQTALDYCTNPANDITGNTKLVAVRTLYAEMVTLRTRAAGKGWIVLEPTGGATTAADVRAAPADFASAFKLSIEDPAGVIQAEKGAHHYRFNGVEIQGKTAVATTLLYWVVNITNRTFEVLSAAPTDTLDDYPSYVIFDRCWVHSGDNVDVKHTIQPEGRYIGIINCYVDDAHCKLSGPNGSGDEQCISTVGAPGPLLIHNNRLRGSGENMLFGGANPPFQDARNRDFTITRNWIEAPLAWQGVYRHKNNTEVKCVERLWAWGNILDGAWDNNQNGTGLNIGSNSSETAQSAFEGNADVIFERNYFRTMTAMFLVTATNTNPAFTYATRRVGFFNNVAVNMDAPATRYNPVDHINQIAAVSGNATAPLRDCVIEHNTMLAHPSVATRAMSIGGTPAGVCYTTYFDNNICSCDSYGVVGDGLGPGTASTSVGIPDDPFAKNVLIAPVGSSAFGGSGFPAASYYPALNTAVGFTDLSWLASADTIDPLLACAGLALAVATTYKGAATDGLDPGANIAAVRAAISGVLSGAPSSSTAWLVQRRDREPVY